MCRRAQDDASTAAGQRVHPQALIVNRDVHHVHAEPGEKLALEGVARVLHREPVLTLLAQEPAEQGEALGDPVDDNDAGGSRDRSADPGQVDGELTPQLPGSPRLRIAQRGRRQLTEYVANGGRPLPPREGRQVGPARTKVQVGDRCRDGLTDRPEVGPGRGGQERDGRPGAGPSCDEPLRRELRVGVDGDPPRDAQVLRDYPGGGKCRSGHQLAGTDGIAQCCRQPHPKRPRRRTLEHHEKLRGVQRHSGPPI